MRRILGLLALVGAAACDCGDGGGLTPIENLIELEPASLDFGAVLVGEVASLDLRMRARSSGAVQLQSLTVAPSDGAFFLPASLPSTVMPGAWTTVAVGFVPSAEGEASGTVRVSIVDGDEPVDVPLAGLGVRAALVVEHDAERCEGDPRSVSFGLVTPGNIAAQDLRLRNAGTVPITLFGSRIGNATSLEFSIDRLSGARITLQPGEVETVRARYAPADNGLDRGLFVVDSDLEGEIRIPTCGTGVATAICASPSPLDLGDVSEHGTHVGTVALESCGQQPLRISAIDLADDGEHPAAAGFTLTRPAAFGDPLPVGRSVSVPVQFIPPGLGDHQTWVRVRSDAPATPELFVPVVAHVVPGCALTLAPNPLVFSAVTPPQLANRDVLVVNDAASACNVTRVAVTTGAALFRLTDTGPFTLGAGESRVVRVQYAPAGGASDRGVLEVESEGNQIDTVDLIGNPPFGPGCQLEADPAFVSFGAVTVGDLATRGIAVRNFGSDSCRIDSATLAAGSSSDLTVMLPAPVVVASQASTTISVQLMPTAGGPVRGTVNLQTTDVDSPAIDVPVFALAAQPTICVMPTELDFGITNQIAVMNFQIFACGAEPVTVTSLDWTFQDPELSLMNPPALPFTLQPGAMMPISVHYVPADNLADWTSVRVSSNDVLRPEVWVEVRGGPDEIPPEEGQFVFYWQVGGAVGDGTILRMPLQGGGLPTPFWGGGTGRTCSGCHSVSPDGRYVALMEYPVFEIVDTTTNLTVPGVPAGFEIAYVAWNPDVNTTPPYQYAYSDESGIVSIASVGGGFIRELQGANDRSVQQRMPTWGPDGEIAFVRGATQGLFGFSGPTDLMVVPESGGIPVALPGASAGTGSNYYPTFSPNGRFIAYTYSASALTTYAAADGQIRLVRADRSGTVLTLPNLNGTMGSASYPTWSLNGRLLSFSSNRVGGPGGWDIYVGQIDPISGADQPATLLNGTSGASFDHLARWSP